jgi:hypothetical protein
MDCGPAFESGVVWCFTWDQPAPGVIDMFALLLSEGDKDWVVVPIRSTGCEAAPASV